MSLNDELKEFSEKAFSKIWIQREGKVVPDPKDLKLSNDAVHFKRATVLYADLSGSTKMVDGKKWDFSAEVYKTFFVQRWEAYTE